MNNSYQFSGPESSRPAEVQERPDVEDVVQGLVNRAFPRLEDQSDDYARACLQDCQSILTTCILYLVGYSKPLPEVVNMKTVVEQVMTDLSDELPNEVKTQLETELANLDAEKLASPEATHTQLELLRTTPPPMVRQLESYLYGKLRTDPKLSDIYTKLVSGI